MADKKQKDENEIEEPQEQKDLKNEPFSSEHSPSLRLVQKSQLSSPFASPVTKRPFAQCSQEKRITKRTKFNCVEAEEKSDSPQAQQQSLKRPSEEKRELIEILKKKEDMLRKLNLVKMYRAKNNLSDLEDLIKKWRSISQTAAQELYEKFCRDKLLSMGQFLDGMRISYDLIKYCEEDETFY